jgi:hypothetical protein
MMRGSLCSDRTTRRSGLALDTNVSLDATPAT